MLRAQVEPFVPQASISLHSEYELVAEMPVHFVKTINDRARACNAFFAHRRFHRAVLSRKAVDRIRDSQATCVNGTTTLRMNR